MENFRDLVKNPQPFTVQGFEALSIGESFNLFFKEFGTAIDRKMATLNKTAHAVDISAVRKHLETNGVLFVRNTGVEILTPEGFKPNLGAMMAYTEEVVRGVYLISSLKTEASRLYDWVKQVIKKGRVENSFRWTISDFDLAVNKAEEFVRTLPDNSRSLRYNLGQVYVNFEEFYGVVTTFNNNVKMLGSRDIELTTKELGNVYDLGQLLVNKIKSNDMLLAPESIRDIEDVINRFTRVANICGALAVLMNELSAVFTEQAKTLSKLK